MLIVMNQNASAENIELVLKTIKENGLEPHNIPGSIRTAIGVTGNTGVINTEKFASLPEVIKVIRVTSPYKLVSRETKPENTLVKIKGVEFGNKKLPVIAGPCSLESKEQIEEIAKRIKDAGAVMLRAGVYKPRTSPYAFQGLGEKGLHLLADISQKYDLPFVTEILDNESLSKAVDYADMLQVGARNMQNFSLLKEVGKSKKPVLLKRGISATLEEFFMAAEYIMSEGNYNIVLCERGVRTFAQHTRFTLDISIIPTIKKLSHLPIIVDPSHAAGERDKVAPLALGAIGAGADGLIIEVHNKPENALSDGLQSLYPKQFEHLMSKIKNLAAVVDKEV